MCACLPSEPNLRSTPSERQRPDLALVGALGGRLGSLRTSNDSPGFDEESLAGLGKFGTMRHAME